MFVFDVPFLVIGAIALWFVATLIYEVAWGWQRKVNKRRDAMRQKIERGI